MRGDGLTSWRLWINPREVIYCFVCKSMRVHPITTYRTTTDPKQPAADTMMHCRRNAAYSAFQILESDRKRLVAVTRHYVPSKRSRV